MGRSSQNLPGGGERPRARTRDSARALSCGHGGPAGGAAAPRERARSGPGSRSARPGRRPRVRSARPPAEPASRGGASAPRRRGAAAEHVATGESLPRPPSAARPGLSGPRGPLPRAPRWRLVRALSETLPPGPASPDPQGPCPSASPRGRDPVGGGRCRRGACRPTPPAPPGAARAQRRPPGLRAVDRPAPARPRTPQGVGLCGDPGRRPPAGRFCRSRGAPAPARPAPSPAGSDPAQAARGPLPSVAPPPLAPRSPVPPEGPAPARRGSSAFTRGVSVALAPRPPGKLSRAGPPVPGCGGCGGRPRCGSGRDGAGGRPRARPGVKPFSARTASSRLASRVLRAGPRGEPGGRGAGAGPSAPRRPLLSAVGAAGRGGGSRAATRLPARPPLPWRDSQARGGRDWPGPAGVGWPWGASLGSVPGGPDFLGHALNTQPLRTAGEQNTAFRCMYSFELGRAGAAAWTPCAGIALSLSGGFSPLRAARRRCPAYRQRPV